MDFQKDFLEALSVLRERAPDFSTFGSGHHFLFGTKVSLSELDAFEEKYNCKLPDDYRTYMHAFGNGGAGPGYGVFALESMGEEDYWKNYVVPGGCFPFTEAYNNLEKLYEGAPDEEDFEDLQAFEEADEAWQEEYYDDRFIEYIIEHEFNGAIPLCDYGCAQKAWLIVDKASPEYGNVWLDLIADQMGVQPDSQENANRLSFSEWMMKWVKTSIAALDET